MRTDPLQHLLPELWPHQLAAIGAAELAMACGQHSGLIVLPTGTGKTFVVLSLGRRLSVPLLFLVNRDELLQQTLRAARRCWPEAHAVAIEAGCTDWDVPTLEHQRRPDLAVAMVPTLVNRLGGISPDRFGLIVADEAHLSVAPTWRKVLEHFQAGFRLGVTATPQRLDGKGLAGLYGREPLYSYSLHQAIKDKRLVDVRPVEVNTATDLDGVGAEEGEDGERDFRRGQLAKAVNTHTRNDLIVAAWLRSARGRRTVAFCVDVGHSQDLATAFRAQGVKAVAVVGKLRTEERQKIYEDFRQGEYQVLTNCEVLTTGFDDPGIEAILLARPTQSRSLLIQMVGRGLRLLGATWEESAAAGKTDCLVIDFTDNCKKHKLVSILDLLGKRKPLTTGPAQQRGPAATPSRQLQLPLQSLVSWTLTSVCPWPELPSTDGYVPLAAWHNEPATDAQVQLLSGYGLQPAEALSKGEASYLIDRAQEFEAAFPLPATDWQRRTLAEHGLWEDGMSRRQARVLIGLAKQKAHHQPTLTESVP